MVVASPTRSYRGFVCLVQAWKSQESSNKFFVFHLEIGRNSGLQRLRHVPPDSSGCRLVAKVSTRQKDFILDPFEIFEQMHLLNEA